MRKIIFWLLLVMCFSTSKAQDLVITTSGDSINCRIDRNAPKSILRIATPNKNGIKWKNLNLEKVSMFSYGFYSSTPAITKSDYAKDLIYPRWRFSTDIGYAKIGDTNGVILNLNGNYYLNKNLGFGLLIETYNTNYKTLEIKKKSALYQFFGVLTYRKLLKEKKDATYISIGLGPIYYHEKKDALSLSQALASENYRGSGIMMEFGYDLGFTKHFSLGTRISGCFGNVNLGKGKEACIKYWTITAGLRYILW